MKTQIEKYLKLMDEMKDLNYLGIIELMTNEFSYENDNIEKDIKFLIKKTEQNATTYDFDEDTFMREVAIKYLISEIKEFPIIGKDMLVMLDFFNEALSKNTYREMIDYVYDICNDKSEEELLKTYDFFDNYGEGKFEFTQRITIIYFVNNLYEILEYDYW